MVTIPRDQVLKRFDILSDRIKDAAFSLTNTETLQRICSEQHLSGDNFSAVSKLVGYVLFGFVSVKDLSKEIGEALGIDQHVADTIASEIDHKIFSPIRTDLEKIYSPIPAVGGTPPASRGETSASQKTATPSTYAARPTDQARTVPILVPIHAEDVINLKSPALTPSNREAPKTQITTQKESRAAAFIVAAGIPPTPPQLKIETPPERIPHAPQLVPPQSPRVEPSAPLAVKTSVSAAPQPHDEGPMILHREEGTKPVFDTARKPSLSGFFGAQKPHVGSHESTPLIARVQIGDIGAEKKEGTASALKSDSRLFQKAPRVVHYSEFATPLTQASAPHAGEPAAPVPLTPPVFAAPLAPPVPPIPPRPQGKITPISMSNDVQGVRAKNVLPPESPRATPLNPLKLKPEETLTSHSREALRVRPLEPFTKTTVIIPREMAIDDNTHGTKPVSSQEPPRISPLSAFVSPRPASERQKIEIKRREDMPQRNALAPSSQKIEMKPIQGGGFPSAAPGGAVPQKKSQGAPREHEVRPARPAQIPPGPPAQPNVSKVMRAVAAAEKKTSPESAAPRPAAPPALQEKTGGPVAPEKLPHMPAAPQETVRVEQVQPIYIVQKITEPAPKEQSIDSRPRISAENITPQPPTASPGGTSEKKTGEGNDDLIDLRTFEKLEN